MKVNIIGKGIIPIPGIGTLAPRYNIELDKRSIEQLLGCVHLTITEAGTNLKITRSNIDGFFKPVTELPTVKPVEVPKQKETYVEPEIEVEQTNVELPPEPTPIEPVEEFVIEDIPEEPVVEEPTVNIVDEPITIKFGNTIETGETEEPKQNKNKERRRKRH